VSFARACPCGSGDPYPSCCGALHTGARHAQTPEQLMRSRYSAFAVGDADYLLRTWHPRTRPAALDLDDGTEWTGLEVHEAAGDEVLFTARYRTPHGTGAMTERSRFAQRGGRWVYVDGDTA
jgi:SEC-C motif-containing protein